MKAAKIFKLIGIIFAVAIFLIILLLGFIFYQLPTAKQVGSFFNKDEKKLSSYKKNESIESTLVTSADTTKLVLKNDESSQLLTDEAIKKNEMAEFIEYTDPKKPMIQFCKYLSTAKTGKIKNFSMKQTSVKNPDGTTTTITKNTDSNTFDDLRLKAIEPLFKTVVMQPEVKKLIYMVLKDESVLEGLDTDIAEIKQMTASDDKLSFYKYVYDAYKSIKSNISNYEDIVDRGYLMYKLNDLIALKPVLQNDQRLLKYCENNENLFNTKIPTRFSAEKEDFERLVQELGVDLKSIGYDKDYKTKLDLNFSNRNLIMSGGWINEIIEMPKEPASK